jgi:hypothetical protein
MHGLSSFDVIPTLLISRASSTGVALMVSRESAFQQQTSPPTPIAASPRARADDARRAMSGPITLDGKLDLCGSGPNVVRVCKSYPKPNAPPTDPTEVRVLYDDALYVGVRMFDARPTRSRRSWRGGTPAASTPIGCT